MSQNERIYEYLLSHPKGITQLEATYKLGVLRLPARISDLRAQGKKILSTRIKVDNRYGGNSYVCRYTLVRETENEQ